MTYVQRLSPEQITGLASMPVPLAHTVKTSNSGESCLKEQIKSHTLLKHPSQCVTVTGNLTESNRSMNILCLYIFIGCVSDSSDIIIFCKRKTLWLFAIIVKHIFVMTPYSANILCIFCQGWYKVSSVC